MADLTPEEIKQVIHDFVNTMSSQQYKGARYVPIVGRLGEESAEWDNTAPYEPLTIVLHEGNSYTSRKYVPVGIGLDNGEYWAMTGEFNGQVAQLRAIVMRFQAQIDANTQAISDEEAARTEADDALDARIDDVAEDLATETETRISEDTDIRESVTNLGLSLDGEIANRENADTSLENTLRDLITDEANARSAADNSIYDSFAPLLLDSRNADEILWFGDSWSSPSGSYGYSGLLPKTVAGMLGEKLHNYSVSGAGWLLQSNSIQTQVEACLEDTSVKAARVRHIVFYCGTNDFVSHPDFDSSQSSIPSAADFTQPISDAVSALRAEFPKAEIHIFFDIRYKYGSIVIPKLNPQIHLWKQVGYNIAANKLGIPHPESAYWPINPEAMNSDGSHITETATKMLGCKVAQSITGNAVEMVRGFDVKEITLANENHPEITGSLYFQAHDERVVFDFYLAISEDVTENVGLGASVGLIPVQLFTSPSVNQLSNRVTVPICCTTDYFQTYINCQLTRYDTLSDVIYLLKGSDDIPDGRYMGHGEFILFA